MLKAEEFLNNYKGVDDDSRSDWYERSTVIQAMEDYAALLPQTPCSSLRELLIQMQCREQKSQEQADKQGDWWIKEDHWENEAAIIRILAAIDAQKPVA